MTNEKENNRRKDILAMAKCVNQARSDNDLIAADVIDLDVQDEEEFEQLKISADKARTSQHSVW